MPSPQGSRGLNPLNPGGVRAWVRDGSERSLSTRLEWYLFEWNFDIVSTSPTLRDVSFSPALKDVSVSPALSSLSLTLEGPNCTDCCKSAKFPVSRSQAGQGLPKSPEGAKLDLGSWTTSDRPQICDLGNPLSLESEETTSPLPLQ